MENLSSLLFDPSQHQLFSCSLLLQPLQSPPPAMSSSSYSSALFFPRSRAAVDSEGGPGLLLATAGSRRAEELANAESEFAFLESKPSLLMLDGRGGNGKGAPGGKGRRHAGEAVLRRKLANQAFLVKIGGGGGGGKELGGGKSGGSGGGRRGRVLSELVADQFAPSVPYSLNRKSRWTREGTDWLAELASGWNGAHRLRLSLSEADYSLAGTDSVRALHRLDTDRAGGRAESRWARSGRGALLADLAKEEEAEAEGEEGQENEAPGEQMHFQLARPHATARVFAGKFFKRKQLFRSAKRSGVELNGSAPSSGPVRGVPPSIAESEPEEENNEFAAQYRPRRETYSLADFLKEAPASPPLLLRRPNGTTRKADADEEQQFAIVPEMECVPLPDEEASELVPAGQAVERCPCPALAALRERLSAEGEAGCFRQFPLALAISGLAQLRELVEQQPRGGQARWLGDELLAMDLSRAVAKEASALCLVLVLTPGELLVNSLIELNEQKLGQALEGGEGLAGKVHALLEAVQSDFADWELGRQRQWNAAGPEQLRASFHSQRMALALRPLQVQALLAQQRVELAKEESQFVGAEELLARERGAEEGDEWEEFELIDMDELLGAAGAAAASSPQSAPKCADCSKSMSPLPLALLPGCGHRLCRECLANGLRAQMGQGQMMTKGVPHCSVCPGQVPFDLLPWVLPLRSANALVLLESAEKAMANGSQLPQCPGCLELLDMDGQQRVEFGQIGCQRCALSWCPKCQGAPHWPLSCGQSGEWTRRTGTAAVGEEAGQPKLAKSAQICGQFAEICSEARVRRLDSRLGWQLGKHLRRLSDARCERRFGMARKTALHLLEFGTAWLYLCRQQRPPGWAQLKSLLWAIRERVECLDNELLFSGSLTNAEGLKAKLADLELLAEKGLAKFGTALKEAEP